MFLGISFLFQKVRQGTPCCSTEKDTLGRVRKRRTINHTRCSYYLLNFCLSIFSFSLSHLRRVLSKRKGVKVLDFYKIHGYDYCQLDISPPPAHLHSVILSTLKKLLITQNVCAYSTNDCDHQLLSITL